MNESYFNERAEIVPIPTTEHIVRTCDLIVRYPCATDFSDENIQVHDIIKRIPIYKSDLNSLNDGVFLNDVITNYFVK